MSRGLEKHPPCSTTAKCSSLEKRTIRCAINVLPNGQALVAGGESYDKSVGALRPIASAELYTP